MVEGSGDGKRARKLELRPAAFNHGQRQLGWTVAVFMREHDSGSPYIGGEKRVGTQRFASKQAKARQGDPAWPAAAAGAR
jgi:hypothetical protein